MINAAVIEKHIELTGKLWTTRCAAARAPNYTRHDLGKLDARVEANLDALLVAGPGVIEACESMLDLETRGGLFVCTYLARRFSNGPALERSIAAALSSHVLTQGFVDGLSFIPWPELAPRLGAMQTSADRAIAALVIEVFTAQRVEPLLALEGEWPMRDPAWHRAATRNVAYVGLSERLPWVYPLLEQDEARVRFSAAVAVVRLIGGVAGQRGQFRARAAAVIDEIAAQPKHPDFELALPLSVRMREQEASAHYAQIRAALPFHARHLAAAALGTVAAADELVADCQDPKLARTAANAFALITGVDLEHADLEGRAPARERAKPLPDDLFTEDGLPALPDTGEAEDDAEDPGEDMLWPDGVRLQQWWAQARPRFNAELRYLAGEPIGVDGGRAVLGKGSQQARYEAAWELALRQPGPLVNTEAPMRGQKPSA
jgi:uncharacterized protein (TIGR02270 family)